MTIERQRNRERLRERGRVRRGRGRMIPGYDVFEGDVLPEDPSDSVSPDIEEPAGEFEPLGVEVLDKERDEPTWGFRYGRTRRPPPLICVTSAASGERIALVQNYTASRRLFPFRSADGRAMTTKLMLAKRVGELIVREGLLSDEGKPRRTIPLKELAERLCGSKTRLSNLRNREWVELESGEVVRLSTFIVAKRGRPVGELTAKIAVEEGRPQRSAVEVRRQLMNRASSEKEQARMEKEIRRGRERRRIAQIIREKPDLSDAEVARLVSSSRAGPRTLSDKERTARSVRAELAKGHDGPT